MKLFSLIKNSSITFADQLVLSGLQFAIGALFIYKGSPEQYGIFVFLISMMTLFGSVQNALINTPLVVLTPRLPDSDQKKFEQGICGALFILIFTSIVITTLWFILQANYLENIQLNRKEVVLFVVSLGPLMLRDFWRADEFAKLSPMQAFRRDATYSGISMVLLLFLVIMSSLQAATAFAMLGIGALAIVMPPTLRIIVPFPKWSIVAESFQQSWQYSKWSLVGAVSSWFQIQAYIFLPFFLIGAKEVAMLAAARLIMQPPALFSSAWSNYLRPLASRKLHEGDLKGVLKLLQTSLALNFTILLCYISIVIICLTYIPLDFLPHDYQSIEKYILLWGLIIGIETVRNSMSALMQSSLAFKPLALRGMTSSILTGGLTIFLVEVVGGSGALVARIGGDLLLLILITIGFRGHLLKAVAHVKGTS